MKKLIFILLLFFSTFSNLFAQEKHLWMFGPMLHVNFGNEKIRTSFSMEVSYWNYEGFPYSFDFALEFEKQKIRLYSELQTGIVLAGLSAGPVLEYNTTEKELNYGLQGSLWINYFFGVDLRIRKTGSNTYFSPGSYLKLPAGIFSADADGNDNNDWDIDWD